jgi:N-acetylglutamate synthase-like GNAT family acetyltransferase
VHRNGRIESANLRPRRAAPKRARRSSKPSAAHDTLPVEPPIDVRLARPADTVRLARIAGLIRDAHEAGAIIALRSEEYLAEAIRDRRAVVVLRGGELVGFATAHPWENGRFVSHSAMVVAPALRGRGLSRKMKLALVELSRQRWPTAAILSLTLSPQVEALNKSCGFEAVPYCDLTRDPGFWKGCEGCVHHAHLKRNQQQDCHCWAGLLLPPGQVREKVIPRDAHGHPSAGSD